MIHTAARSGPFNIPIIRHTFVHGTSITHFSILTLVIFATLPSHHVRRHGGDAKPKTKRQPQVSPQLSFSRGSSHKLSAGSVAESLGSSSDHALNMKTTCLDGMKMEEPTGSEVCETSSYVLMSPPPHESHKNMDVALYGYSESADYTDWLLDLSTQDELRPFMERSVADRSSEERVCETNNLSTLYDEHFPHELSHPYDTEQPFDFQGVIL